MNGCSESWVNSGKSLTSNSYCVIFAVPWKKESISGTSRTHLSSSLLKNKSSRGSITFSFTKSHLKRRVRLDKHFRHILSNHSAIHNRHRLRILHVFPATIFLYFEKPKDMRIKMNENNMPSVQDLIEFWKNNRILLVKNFRNLQIKGYRNKIFHQNCVLQKFD